MILAYILVMAGVTYLVRMLPLVIFKRKIENRFVKSFMFYIPFAVLAAMTFPAVFSSTTSIYSAAAGTAVALILSFKEKSLLTVALAACVTVYAVEWLMRIAIST